MKKWTLVTGGAKRLGASICDALADNGYPILLHYNTSQAYAEEMQKKCLAKGVEAEIIKGDFSTRTNTDEFIQRLLSKYSAICHVIHNVGNFLVEGPITTPVMSWEALMQTNLFAPIALSQALIPQIIQNQGKIVTLGMMGLNQLAADTYSTAYTATKASLLLYTKALAKELAPHQVTVNMVSPGQLDNAVDLPRDLTTFPMGRAGRSEEVSRVIVFLLDPKNSYITGQNIEVAGALNL